MANCSARSSKEILPWLEKLPRMDNCNQPIIEWVLLFSWPLVPIDPWPRKFQFSFPLGSFFLFTRYKREIGRRITREPTIISNRDCRNSSRTQPSGTVGNNPIQFVYQNNPAQALRVGEKTFKPNIDFYRWPCGLPTNKHPFTDPILLAFQNCSSSERCSDWQRLTKTCLNWCRWLVCDDEEFVQSFLQKCLLNELLLPVDE